MEPADAADSINEVADESATSHADERFRGAAALLIAILAMLLAITSLGGGNVTEDMILANIHSSDTWAFYQAKNVRQTQYKIALDELELRLVTDTLSDEARRQIEKRIADYRSTIERYESEPDPKAPSDPLKGEGKKELKAQAIDWERQRDAAQVKDPNFDYAEVLFQIAIVLGSVSILAKSKGILWLSAGVGVVALVLMSNGFTGFFQLPF